MTATSLAFPLSDRINSLAESQTIAMSKKARELAAQGHDVINLTLGEPDFRTPAYIGEAAKKAIDEGFTFYTPVPGIPELRKAIVAKLQRDNGVTYTPEQIVVSTGAKQSIANAILCLVNPGDEVVILGPYWVSYMEIVKLAGGEPIIVGGTVENGFKPGIEEISAAITERTKVIMYSSPSNPTGAMFTREELQALAQEVQKHDNLFVLADEIYEYINFGEIEHVSIASLPGMAERTITVNGFSKGFAMTGWRVGYIAAPRWIADACDKMQGQFTSGTCSIAQKAAYAALANDPELSATKEMTQAFARRRALIVDLARTVPGWKVLTPPGAFYIFPEVSAYYGKKFGEQVIANSTDLCMYLLNEAHVSLVPGDAFGEDSCLRISFAAADEKIIAAIERIKKALSALN